MLVTMSRRDAFDRIGEVATAVLASGDEINGSFNDLYESGNLGLYIQRQNSVLQARTTQGVRFVILSYKLELSNELKSRFDRQQATDILPSDQIEHEDSDDTLAKRAAIWHLDAVDKESLDEAYETAIAIPNAEVNWQTLHSEVPHGSVPDGFEISRRVYPSEDSFSVAEYDQSARSLRHYGLKAGRTLLDSLEVFDGDSQPELASEEAGADTPAFQ